MTLLVTSDTGPTNENWNRFQFTLTDAYTRLYASGDPAYQLAKATHTPEQLAAKMTLGLADGSASKDGEGIQQTCQALGIKHTYKSIRAYLRGESTDDESTEDTFSVTLKDGSREQVKRFCGLKMEIDGTTFSFVVHQEVSGIGKCIAHKESGLRICALSVGASYLPAFAKLNSDKDRARLSIQQVIDRHGAARVRAAIQERRMKPAINCVVA